MKSLQLCLKDNQLILTVSAAFSEKPFISTFATKELTKEKHGLKATLLVQTT